MSRIDRITKTLTARFTPLELDVENFSHEHNVPKGSDSHLRVRIIAQEFEGLLMVKRHRLIYAALGEEMQNGLHALQLQTLSPTEWAEKQQSPKCRGGETVK